MAHVAERTALILRLFDAPSRLEPPPSLHPDRFKLKPEVKEKWLAMLRDPEMKQTTQQLGIALIGNAPGQVSKSFCCLGVLCEAVGDTLQMEYDPKLAGVSASLRHGTQGSATTTVPLSSIGPRVFISHDGFEPVNPTVWLYDYTGRRIYVHLTELNDHYKMTFKEIADIIEQQL